MQSASLRRRTRAAVLKLGLALVFAVPGACGFHLEGRTPLPQSMKAAYVQATDHQTDFVQSLRKALLTSGARPALDKATASSVVNILKDEVVRRTLSVSALNRPNDSGSVPIGGPT